MLLEFFWHIFKILKLKMKVWWDLWYEVISNWHFPTLMSPKKIFFWMSNIAENPVERFTIVNSLMPSSNYMPLWLRVTFCCHMQRSTNIRLYIVEIPLKTLHIILQRKIVKVSGFYMVSPPPSPLLYKVELKILASVL